MAEIARLKSTLAGHRNCVTSVAFHPRANLLATGSSDNAKLWGFSPNGLNANCMATLAGHVGSSVTSVAFHPTANLLATGSSDRTAKLWSFSLDGLELACVATLAGHSRGVRSVAFHPTANLLATGSADNTAKLWSFSLDGLELACVTTLAEHRDWVTSVAFHPRANLLATGSNDGTAKLWGFSPNGSNANCVATLAGHSSYVYSVAFHPTANLLATGSLDYTAKLWGFSPNGLNANCMATLAGHRNCVTSVAFHPTANLLATGSFDNTAKLWRFSPNGLEVNCVATLAGHSGYVQSVAFHKTANLLATGSLDDTAKLWELNLGNNRNRLSVSSNLPALTISNNEDRRIIINIPRELRLESKNSTNKSCPNFKPLYDQVMLIDLNRPFRFHFEGESARDAKGLTKIVYDFLLPVYTKLYFKKVKDFILLKEDISIEELNRDTSQIIKLAEAGLAQFYLQIHPKLIELLLLQNPPESIAERQNFNDLYANLKNRISTILHSGLNISNYLPNNTPNQKIESADSINSLSREIQAEIILRKILVDFGFESWVQYQNMATFIKTFWNDSKKLRYHNKGRNVEVPSFSCELKYDIESFKRRLQIKKSGSRELLNLNRRNAFPIEEYPALGPLLEYILNPDEAADINRRKFVKYVAGTEYTLCQIDIILKNEEIPFDTNNRTKLYRLPFLAHTCFSTLDLFKTPLSSNYPEEWTVERIDEEITKGSGLAAHN